MVQHKTYFTLKTIEIQCSVGTVSRTHASHSELLFWHVFGKAVAAPLNLAGQEESWRNSEEKLGTMMFFIFLRGGGPARARQAGWTKKRLMRRLTHVLTPHPPHLLE